MHFSLSFQTSESYGQANSSAFRHAQEKATEQSINSSSVQM